MNGVDPVIEWVSRLSIAMLLLTTARHKFSDLSRFTATVRNYRILPGPVARVAALSLALTELAVSILLLVPGADPFGPLAALGLIALYSGAIGINLARGRREMDCGCLGPLERQALSSWLLLRNAGLALAPTLLLFRNTSRLISWIDAISVLGGVGILAILWSATHQLTAARPALRPQERSA